MKKRSVSSILAGFAMLSLAILFSCKSDPAQSSTSADVQGSDEQSAFSEAQAPAEGASAFRTPESIVTTAQDLLVKHSELRDRIAGLQEQLLKVPADVKQNVVDYGQLEATLDGYTEKGDYRLDELYRVLDQTKQDLASGATASKKAEAGNARISYLEVDQILVEHTRSVEEIEKEYEKLKVAVEKLVQAPNKGKGLRLFE